LQLLKLEGIYLLLFLKERQLLLIISRNRKTPKGNIIP